jgi:hypothetical protein
MRRRWTVWLLGALWMTGLALLSAPPVYAASVEALLMPGPVTRAHLKQEAQCSNCHDRSNARTQTALCLDCHKEVAVDVRDRRGYHGRMPNAGAGECRACHTEHKGRDADIVQLSPAQFDHSLTEFALEGAHRALECASCHKSGEAWRKAPLDCVACHKSDDVHRGQFTQACGDCHGSASWAGGRFDHDTTDYRLTGAHERTACNACHLGGRYKETPKSCNSCHETDDVHRGSRGTDCARCHTTTEWKTAKYDHLKETGYALLGAHDRLDCLGCHRSGDYKQKIPKTCNGCHEADDAHAARFGEKCEDCHDNEHWAPVTYDHLARTKFALIGAHAKLDCHVCHTAPVATQKLGTDCVSCHRGADPHAGKVQGGCENCHGQDSWRTGISFDHDFSDFPLLGLHRVVACAQCHTTLAYGSAPTTCIECHSREDVHHGGLGKRCESCHSPNGWALWRFDHAKETHFALIGGHAGLQCADCHREAPGTTKTSPLCISCHRQDDRHLGAYGEQCERCHTSYTWKGARIQ